MLEESGCGVTAFSPYRYGAPSIAGVRNTRDIIPSEI